MPDASDRTDEQRDRLLLSLREHGTLFGELGRRFGAQTGLHTTDAAALVEILAAQDRGAPLTQVELSQHIGLTPGATSALLNRLEAAGHVTRARDSADRRVVTLRATPGVDAMVDRFFDPLTERMGTMMSKYPPELLTEFGRFLDDVCATMTAYAQENERSRT